MDKSSSIVFVLIAIPTVLIVVLGFLFISKDHRDVSSSLQESTQAKLEVVGSNEDDWGEIDINGGLFERTYKIKNSGESDLEIANFKTSCMCTTAKIKINGQTSPVFGMHTTSNWKGSIKPGEEAEIEVVFDPMAHGPQATGPITRIVSFNSNDSDNKNIEYKFVGNVIKK